MRLKVAFFDIDGTLIHRKNKNNLTLKSRAFNYAMRTVLGIDDVDYAAILGNRIYGSTDKMILKMTINELGFNEKSYYDNETRLFTAIDEYFEGQVAKAGAFDYSPLTGIFEMLGFLKSHDVILGLVTGNIKKHSDWKIAQGGFDGYFTTGAYGEDGETRAQILSVAIERCSRFPLSLFCHFGDSPLDIEAAKTCGVRCVVISDKGGGTHPRKELEMSDHGLIVDSWFETNSIKKYLA